LRDREQRLLEQKIDGIKNQSCSIDGISHTLELVNILGEDGLDGVLGTFKCGNGSSEITLGIFLFLCDLGCLGLASGLNASDLLFLDTSLFVLDFEILQESISNF